MTPDPDILLSIFPNFKILRIFYVTINIPISHSYEKQTLKITVICKTFRTGELFIDQTIK